MYTVLACSRELCCMCTRSGFMVVFAASCSSIFDAASMHSEAPAPASPCSPPPWPVARRPSERWSLSPLGQAIASNRPATRRQLPRSHARLHHTPVARPRGDRPPVARRWSGRCTYLSFMGSKLYMPVVRPRGDRVPAGTSRRAALRQALVSRPRGERRPWPGCGAPGAPVARPRGDRPTWHVPVA
ncbi:hypothetical protein BS78_04G312400 [Paspalum vaginatum]|nr:hypothetical protein BS78_04G312400 [Paspalum vaginatum]